MSLHMMSDKGLKYDGAVCLDGTDAGFYIQLATDPAHANDWQLYFQGGGWCYDEEDCYGRSMNNLGSSSVAYPHLLLASPLILCTVGSQKWSKTMSLQGMMFRRV